MPHAEAIRRGGKTRIKSAEFLRVFFLGVPVCSVAYLYLIISAA